MYQNACLDGMRRRPARKKYRERQRINRAPFPYPARPMHKIVRRINAELPGNKIRTSLHHCAAKNKVLRAVLTKKSLQRKNRKNYYRKTKGFCSETGQIRQFVFFVYNFL